MGGMVLQKTGRGLQKKLRNYMAEHGLKTGRELAGRADVSHQTVFAWLNGQNTPPERAAKRLAEKLECPDIVDVCDRDRRARVRAKRKAVA